MTKKKKLEIRFLVGTTISYIRRGPFPSLACDSMRGASLSWARITSAMALRLDRVATSTVSMSTQRR